MNSARRKKRVSKVKRSKTRARSRGKKKAFAAFLSKSHPAVRTHLRASTALSTFISTSGVLTLAKRKQLVDQALVLLEQNYVHLPLKRAMHAVDPIQRLKLLRHRLNQLTNSTMPAEAQFHREMTQIFASVRDLHTNYVLPEPFNKVTAFLPFLVEEYFEQDTRRYVVSHVMDGFSHPHFKEGVDIVHWNGVPVDRAVEINADRHAGSNPDARHARGLEHLTIRPLAVSPHPDAEWVVVGFRAPNGDVREHKFEWLIFQAPDPGSDGDGGGSVAQRAAIGSDLEVELINRMKKVLFAPAVVAAERKLSRSRARTKGGRLSARAVRALALTSSLPSLLAAKSVDTPNGTFGYIRIFSFNLPRKPFVVTPDDFVNEFVRLASQLPQHGLIVDVRGNGGGHIHASEQLLQVLTPHRITPEPTQFINSSLNIRLCERHKTGASGIDLGPWLASMKEAIKTGAAYSRAFPITTEQQANNIGQQYIGPVVLITDAKCYSATDIFAAGFQDHKIGPVLGTDNNTGAGGANVWEHGLFKLLMELPTPSADNPYVNLPNGANMRASIRRTLRVGHNAGTPVEDLGVMPDHRHFMTRADVLEGNVDLINRAGELLHQMPRYRLDAVATAGASGELTIALTTKNINRLDVYIDTRPQLSRSISSASTQVTLPSIPGADELQLVGYKGDELVAIRRVEL